MATAFALAVTWPEAGNIGGGGFMMVHPPDGNPPICIDYRETAPDAANPTMFLHDDRRYTCKMVGVPGTVRGLALAHQKYGRLPWRQLVLPAAGLAKEGFEVDSELASSINRVLERLPQPPLACTISGFQINRGSKGLPTLAIPRRLINFARWGIR